MLKEIKYSGLSNVPGDYECEDGGLAASIDLTVENGEVKPFVRPKPFMKIQGRLLGVHKGSGYENFITLDSEVLYTQTRDSARVRISAYRKEAAKIETIGNTFVVISDSAPLHYFLFKEERYIDLGDKPPFVPISFGLRGTFKKSEEVKIELAELIRHRPPCPRHHQPFQPQEQRLRLR